ncbi:MAG: nuclear transport factor 2 family protein [Burkholderiaceae bacterium]
MRQRFTTYASAEAVEDAFYEALRKGDLATLMEIWADDDDVVCIHPGGRRDEGLAAVRESWAQILREGGMPIRATQRRFVTGAVLAVHHVVEAIEVRETGKSRTVYCHATNVFAKDAMGWRLVSHHASPPGESAPADVPTASGGVLH